MMRARNQGMYLSVSSYSAVALLARKRLLDFCRVVHVVRNGQIVKRMIHAPDVTQDERRAAPAVFYAKARRALRIARGYDGDTRDAIIRVARRWRALARAARKSVMQKGNAS